MTGHTPGEILPTPSIAADLGITVSHDEAMRLHAESQQQVQMIADLRETLRQRDTKIADTVEVIRARALDDDLDADVATALMLSLGVESKRRKVLVEMTLQVEVEVEVSAFADAREIARNIEDYVDLTVDADESHGNDGEINKIYGVTLHHSRTEGAYIDGVKM